MADITVKVIDPADSYALMTLDEMKIMLGIPATDTSEDALITLWIDQYSDVIATMCNRVFAKERVQETWRGDTPPYDTQNGRVFLTHYPVADDDIESVFTAGGSLIDPSGYEIENRSGKLQFFGQWGEPIIVTYAGGYVLPDECPPALKQALVLFVQGARMQQSRSLTSGIRSISHRESRVQFFDYMASQAKMTGSNPIAAAGDTIKSLLYHYVRFYV